MAGNSLIDFPSKEEIDAYFLEQIREMFPEKPEDYVPGALEIIKRLADMAKEADVSIGD